MKFYAILVGLIFSIVLLASVSADTNTNDSYADAEVIGEGTYTGKVGYPSDEYDWYKVEGMGDREVTVRAKLTSEGMEDNREILSCGGYGIPDGQTEIYLGEWETEDYCHWQDPGDTGVMYISVMGSGEYELKIEFEGSSSSSPGPAPWLLITTGGCCLSIIVVGVIIAVVAFMKKK